jgi:hypothetical protein
MVKNCLSSSGSVLPFKGVFLNSTYQPFLEKLKILKGINGVAYGSKNKMIEMPY